MRTNSGQSDYCRRKLSQDGSEWLLKGIITRGNTLVGENDNEQRDHCARQPMLFLGDAFLYRWLSGPFGLGLHAMLRGKGNGVSLFFIRKPLG